jgi:hypothetical protein
MLQLPLSLFFTASQFVQKAELADPAGRTASQRWTTDMGMVGRSVSVSCIGDPTLHFSQNAAVGRKFLSNHPVPSLHR